MYFLAFTVWMCNTMSARSIMLQDENVLVRDNAKLKVDIPINEKDYEMIDQNQLISFKIDIINEKFNNFNEFAKEENEKPQEIDDMEPINQLARKYTSPVPNISNLKPITSHTVLKREILDDEDIEYNYDELAKEYYDETANDVKSKETYQIKKSDKTEDGVLNSIKEIITIKSNYNCSETDIRGIGLKSIKCLWDDYINQRRSPDVVRPCLWRIIKIWLLLYLVIAIPLGCTRGWCCCCLFCKFCNPRQTIAEAKKYVQQNPPGILKVKNGEVEYDPTEIEREAFEEFEHFIRTL